MSKLKVQEIICCAVYILFILRKRKKKKGHGVGDCLEVTRRYHEFGLSLQIANKNFPI